MKSRTPTQVIRLKLIALIFLMLALTACETDPVKVSSGGLDFSRGVFIVNEGNFLAGNASVSFYDPALDSVFNQVFYRINQAPLGDVANSMTISGDRAFVPVNNSGRIYVMDAVTMKYQGKITGLTSPRNLVVVGENKAYVTDLAENRIGIIHPESLDQVDSTGVTDHIDLGGYTSEQILVSGNKAFVACWSYGDKVMVIDTGSDTLVDSVQVGKQPNSMAMDNTGDIWVLCDGGYPGSPYGQENASLWLLDTETLRAGRMLEFSDIMDSPSDIAMNATGDTIYYLNGGIFCSGINYVQESTFIEAGGRQFYGLAVDPFDNTIYVADAVDYQQNGWVYRYAPEGVLLDSFRVGINPGSFCFTKRSP